MVGGGAAGLELVTRLGDRLGKRKLADIALIERSRTHLWKPLLHSVAAGAMDPPVVGGFHGDRGEFYGRDTDAGRPVLVRFIWTRLGPDAARWEQAFSYAGSAWQTNWVMAFRRA